MSLSGVNKDSLYGKRGRQFGSTESFTSQAPYRASKASKEGPLQKAAKESGMTLLGYAQSHKGDKGVAGKRSRFYLNVIYPRKRK